MQKMTTNEIQNAGITVLQKELWPDGLVQYLFQFDQGGITQRIDKAGWKIRL